jgi:hypothetical protein
MTVQTTDAVFMVLPTRFGFNAQAAESNTYQENKAEPAADIAARARYEALALQALLSQNGVSVFAVDDEAEPHTPDSLFPNNWFSTHEDGTLVLYPMAVPNRRAERRPQVIAELKRRLGVRRLVDLTPLEERGLYLEGTGSLVLDRVHRIAYAARSLRTDPQAVLQFGRELDYRPVIFETRPRHGLPSYHTNIVMSVGEGVAVVCLDAIATAAQRQEVAATLAQSGLRLISISLSQMDNFAGNLLFLRNAQGERLWVMSRRAFLSLGEAQRGALAGSGRILATVLDTIESVGGGSARCMLAELYSGPSPP